MVRTPGVKRVLKWTGLKKRGRLPLILPPLCSHPSTTSNRGSVSIVVIMVTIGMIIIVEREMAIVWVAIIVVIRIWVIPIPAIVGGTAG